MYIKNKGFSLIELSIVLIIIGLLVAGVTGGASLIRSARLSAIASEINGIKLAINAFYLETGRMPGVTNRDDILFINDAGAFWNDLHEAGIMDFKPADPEGEPSKTNSMESKYKGIYYLVGTLSFGFATKPNNAIWLVGLNSEESSEYVVTELKRKDIEYIGKKLNVRYVITDGTSEISTNNTLYGACDIDDSDSKEKCIIFYKLDSFYDRI